MLYYVHAYLSYLVSKMMTQVPTQVQMQMRIPKSTLAQGQPQLQMTHEQMTAWAAQMARQTTVDEVHTFHCFSHPFRPPEVQAPIHAVEQEPIAAAQTPAQVSTLPVEAVAAGIAYRGGLGERNCLHAHSHNHNRMLSAHSRHIRVLPVQLAA